ncbi:MAG: 2-oxoacid:acceptor oxidoreductase family protein [Proteobacteria bacterium]|nr:2-oxoacid:acceptor oxidoreductase family protein [Pseudomonadota bacterium]
MIDKLQAVIAGVGGQGILFLTRVLAAHTRSLDWPVLVSEVHGMSQRGGSVVSHLKAGDFQSPLVRQGRADLVISLEPGEAVRNLGYLRPAVNGGPGATLLVNAPDEAWLSAEARATLDQAGIARLNVGADRIALANRAPLSANLVVLGYGSAREAVPFGAKEMLETILRISPPRFQEQNQKLFNLGVEAA